MASQRHGQLHRQLDTQRYLALDWIMDMRLEVQRLLVRLQFFIVLDYPLLKKIHVI